VPRKNLAILPCSQKYEELSHSSLWKVNSLPLQKCSFDDLRITATLRESINKKIYRSGFALLWLAFCSGICKLKFHHISYAWFYRCCKNAEFLQKFHFHQEFGFNRFVLASFSQTVSGRAALHICITIRHI
jgi:hypothetical protein